ncbi:MAG: cation-translocating P-type ATPase, partial [candidate division NC10 bacterium]|nr:cation-translocating P-type ATPase [candidate division NC10 bacterium]
MEKHKMARQEYGLDEIERESGKSVLLNIEDMCCPDEAELLEKKLKGLNGIRDFEINLMSQKVRVDYDPALVSIQEVIKSIAETGMRARLERGKAERGRPWYLEPKVIFISICTFLTLSTLFLERLVGFPHQVATYIYGIAIVIGIYYPARIALSALRAWTFNINTLLVVATAGAVTLGLWDEAAVLVFVYTWGAILEAYAVDRSRGALRALMELSPKEALVKREDLEIALPVEEIRVGDVIIIRPGEKIPMDGRVLAGTSSVDQSPITGESMPVRKAEGNEVFAGSLNQRGSLEVTVTKPFKDTTLARIIHSVEEAQAKKTRYQRFGERFGKIYTPAMFSLALAVMLFPPLIFGGPWQPWFYRGLIVFVVSCS